MKPTDSWCVECARRGKTFCSPCVDRSNFKPLKDVVWTNLENLPRGDV